MTEAPRIPTGESDDIRPRVVRSTAQRGVWIFAVVLLVVGGGIFYGLQTRRLANENASLLTSEPPGDGPMILSPPALNIPAAPDFETTPDTSISTTPTKAPSAPVELDYPKPTSVRFFDQRPVTQLTPQPSEAKEQPASGVTYQAPVQSGPTRPDKSKTNPEERVHAHPFKNPGSTVPLGSVIQAVMETALDSTRAGFARAIVSHDVYSFDGSRVLIPRGSRLFGAYEADVSLGQKRALIQWQRLTRPDGIIIDLDSPSADPLGRAGLKGKVNTHFFQRFGGAILQSVLDVGVNVAASRASGNTVILGSSGLGDSSSTEIQDSSSIKPTLTIKQGASVSVFVARDLDFSEEGD